MTGFVDIESIFPDGQELFVGITLKKKEGKFVVSKQFCKIKASEPVKNMPFRRKETALNKTFSSLDTLEVGDDEF
jgi:hypothetical protein